MSFLPESYNVIYEWPFGIAALGTARIGFKTGKYDRSSRLGNVIKPTLHIFTISTKADFVQWGCSFFEDVT